MLDWQKSPKSPKSSLLILYYYCYYDNMSTSDRLEWIIWMQVGVILIIKRVCRKVSLHVKCIVWFACHGWICTWVSGGLADLRPRSKNTPALYMSVTWSQIYTGARAGAHLRACERCCGALTSEPAPAKYTLKITTHKMINAKQRMWSCWLIQAPAFLLGWGLRGPRRRWLIRWRLFLFFGIHTLHLKLLHIQYTQFMLFKKRPVLEMSDQNLSYNIWSWCKEDLCLHALTLPDDGIGSPLHSGLCVECSLYRSVLPASQTCACSPGSAL